MAYNRMTAGEGALNWATRKLGAPYVWGGDGPGYDCSGLWFCAYAQVGIMLPRTTYQMYDYGDTVLGLSTAWQPGDLAFIMGADPMDGEPGHVLGYVGIGEISGADQHLFKPNPRGLHVFLDAPYTGDPGGVRFDYCSLGSVVAHTRPALLLPDPPIPEPNPHPQGHPTAFQLRQCNVVGLATPSQEQQAKANGWTIWYFSTIKVPGGHFYPALAGLPKGTELYANARWRSKRLS